MRGNGTAHAIPSKDLVKEINALKAQLKRVSDAMAADASDGVNRAIDAVESKSRRPSTTRSRPPSASSTTMPKPPRTPPRAGPQVGPDAR